MDKITTILFDLDGTLLDTRESIYQGFVHALSTFGHKTQSKEEIFTHVGKEFSKMVEGIAGPIENPDDFRNAIRDYQASNLHLVKSYPLVEEVLKTLKKKDYKLGAVTNARRPGSLKRLKHVGILELFDTVVTVDDASHPKPHPAPVTVALKNLDTLPEFAVMIGDSHFDIESGKSAGTKTIRVTYGFHTEEMDNPKPDLFIDDISELLKLF